MKPKHWEQAKKILPKLRELPVEERPAFLAEACNGDPELLEELQSFLDSDAEAISFLDAPPVRLLDEEPAPLSDGSQVGSYQVLRILGSGGMGVVYLAARTDDEFHREVALKVLRPEARDEDSDRRFRREMAILAKLNHPNIARLYEGGTTEDGRLYYLMEYVEGQPITDYCREHDLSLEQRLSLFSKVCEAVQYAHQNLVVHRDLKPSNILVTKGGEPKLLDFGVAKLLEEPGSTTEALTGGSLRLFTPKYASPEQISGTSLTTASDTYSLGVILYELLAGVPPYSFENQDAAAIHQIVCQQTPLLPSEASAPAPDSGQDPTALAFRKRLRGDLDTIVMMAIRKEPERRYGSPLQLSEDLDRYLKGLPVQARDDTFGYRIGRLFRRHPGKSAAILLAILLSLSAAWIMKEQRDETARERDRAEMVSEFMVGIFEAANPDENQGSVITARALLDAAKDRVLASSDQDPETRAQLLVPLQQTYGALGLYQESLALSQTLLDLQKQASGPESPETARALNLLGLAENHTAQYELALRHLLQAARLWSTLEGPQSLELASTLDHLGLVYRNQGDYSASAEAHQQSLQIRQQHLPESASLVGDSLFSLGTARRLQGDYANALQTLEEALEWNQNTLGPDHPNTLNTLIELAVLYRRVEDPGKSEDAFVKALALGQKLYPDGHPSIASLLNNYGIFKAHQLDYGHAEQLYKRSIAMEKSLRKESHPNIANTLGNLALILQKQERYPEAKDAFEEAFEIYSQYLPENHPRVLSVRASYAYFLWLSGEGEAGIRLFEEVAQQRRAAYGDDAPIIASDLQNLAFLRQSQGQLAEAEELAREALSRDSGTFSPRHSAIVRDQHRLASILEESQQYEEAEALIADVLDALSSQSSPDPLKLADARSILGACMAGRGLTKEARPILEESYLAIKSEKGADAWETKTAGSRLQRLTKRPSESL
ncbi:MAG: serine/threonine protein kinase [Acidobacteria bacterium]|nr:serine/threonine protein kinase [Acidobacteriota bacterium]